MQKQKLIVMNERNARSPIFSHMRQVAYSKVTLPEQPYKEEIVQSKIEAAQQKRERKNQKRKQQLLAATTQFSTQTER